MISAQCDSVVMYFSGAVTQVGQLPGCNPSQLHQAQAHLARLLLEHFTQHAQEVQTKGLEG